MLQKQQSMPQKRGLYKFQISIMKLKYLAAAALLYLFVGCGATKDIKGSVTANAALSANVILKAHKAADQDFKTLAARMQVRYEDPEQSQSITTSLRVEKDKIIWIKASVLGITLAKVLITPDQVQLYETLSNSYFAGDFSLISDLLGTQINFEQVQSLLLGHVMFNLKPKSVSTALKDNKYRVAPIKQEANYLLSILLNPDNFMVYQAQISQPDAQRNLMVQYGPYQKIEGSFYPTQIGIQALDVLEETSIAIKFKKIDLNVSMSFPFTIPKGYTQSTFK
ncbi:MAG: outer membrane biogenesis lipoprotein LolB [Patiriisocius sp.]|jgi:outer membrane biogenesis lipoprotein LolB